MSYFRLYITIVLWNEFCFLFSDFDDLLKHNLQWELPSLGSAGMGNKGLDYDGMPFVIIATKVLDCQHGVDRHLKRKLVTDNIRV